MGTFMGLSGTVDPGFATGMDSSSDSAPSSAERESERQRAIVRGLLHRALKQHRHVGRQRAAGRESKRGCEAKLARLRHGNGLVRGFAVIITTVCVVCHCDCVCCESIV